MVAPFPHSRYSGHEEEEACQEGEGEDRQEGHRCQEKDHPGQEDCASKISQSLSLIVALV